MFRQALPNERTTYFQILTGSMVPACYRPCCKAHTLQSQHVPFAARSERNHENRAVILKLKANETRGLILYRGLRELRVHVTFHRHGTYLWYITTARGCMESKLIHILRLRVTCSFTWETKLMLGGFFWRVIDSKV